MANFEAEAFGLIGDADMCIKAYSEVDRDIIESALGDAAPRFDEYWTPLHSESKIQQELFEAKQDAFHRLDCNCPEDIQPCKHKIAQNYIEEFVGFLENRFTTDSSLTSKYG
jgi:uncharacterized Zn finger protein